MSNRVPKGEPDLEMDALDAGLASFSTKLSDLGYCSIVVRQKRAMAAAFARWALRQRLDVATIDEEAVETYLTRCRRRRNRIGNRRCTLSAFLEHLRSQGTTVRPEPVHGHFSRDLVPEQYATYLRVERGLGEGTVANYQKFVRPFIHEYFALRASDAASALNAQDVRDFLLNRARTLSCSTAQLLATTLRSFLRFLFRRGDTSVDLSLAVPTVRRWRQSGVHPYLRPEEVEGLLETCDRTTASGLRDHAILLLLARLGLRAGEVAALEVGDLRWRSSEILVRGKGRVLERLPLLAEIGDAVALYLQHGRPKTSCRNVFLRNLAPRVGLSPDGVSVVVRRALDRAGLCPPRRGSHLLRFSLATTLIRQGASMAEIGEVLRHRSPETTEIYAKVDFEALRTVALPWPGPGGAL